MGTGRDAADVALTTSFGRMDLVKFLVISDGRAGVTPSLRAKRSNPCLRSRP